ncbi:MAG: SCP2 sterol-binding domain-containing protein [Nitrospirae bacterium]|nr:SCP2 sterol-binding domain-containing protein [Nitrospirota bacterium]
MADEVTPQSSPEEIKKIIDSVGADRNALRQQVLKNATPKQVFEIIMPYGATKNPQGAERLKGVKAVYQFNLEGDGGGQWQIKVADGALAVASGTPDPAQCTITLKVDDWKAMNTGTLNPQAAFMQGKLRIQGDMSLAMRLGAILGTA